jgi:hypothetical protein
LLHFGLRSIADLPPLEELEESFAEGDFSGFLEERPRDREEEVLQQLALVEDADEEQPESAHASVEHDDAERDHRTLDEQPHAGARNPESWPPRGDSPEIAGEPASEEPDRG